MKEYTDIGNRLKLLRGALSQTEFALKLNIPFRTYQRYEAGERLPKRAVLQWIASVCGKPVEWILTGADRVAQPSTPYRVEDISAKLQEMLRDIDKELVLKLTGLSNAELEEVLRFADFVKSKRGQKEGL